MAKDDKNKTLLDLEGRLSSGRTEEQSLREQEQEMVEQRSTIEAALEEILPRQKTLLRSTEQFKAELDQVRGAVSEKEARLAAAGRELEERVEAGEEIALELSDIAASLEACEARRNLLQDMMLQFEGYESGVVTTLEMSERWPSLVGTVADTFVPVEGMETALEAALGEMARFLICFERPDAQRVIQYLKDEHKGKVGILVPQTGAITPSVKRPELDANGVIGWLDTFVSTEEPLRPLKEAILARTVVISPGASIDAVLQRLPYGFAAVTTDGVLYGANLVAGGSDDRFPLFRRKEKVAEQEALIEELRHNSELARERKNQNTAQIAGLRAETAQLNTDIESLREEAAEAQQRLGECEYQSRTLTADFERLNREKSQLNQRLEKIRSRQYTLGLDANELASKKASLVDTMNQTGVQLEDLERAAQVAAETVSRLQVGAIEARSRCEQTESQITHIRELLADIGRTRATKAAEIEQAEHDIAHASETRTRLEAELQQAFAAREELTASQEQLRQAQTDLTEQTTTREKAVKQLRQEKDTVSERLHQTEIRLTTITSESSALAQKMREEYFVDLETLEVERPDDKVADADVPALLADMKAKLHEFGAVNLLALEEYEVASEREKFLNEQLTDLTKAKNDLRSTINKINHTAKELFEDTFSKVRENFRNLFVELFKGGEADISLVEPDDPLESDINIVARPGGKRLLPITILSGGERALTSIALLFSLYLVKPSPFCILDEIDAPLDDANCHRFLTIIRNFSERTQFIIITHNKITMQTSHNLYGVTMERAGVSKLVAVKFADDNGDGSGHLVTVEADDADEQTADPEPLPPAIRERMTPDVAAPQDNE